MTIKQIFDEIANEPGTNKKMDILRKYKDNELLVKVLYLSNSKRIKFYIKQIPDYTSNRVIDTLDNAIDKLSVLSNRTKTGSEGIEFLRSILSNLSQDDAYIIERIIDKDCKIGMGTTNMNKVFPKLIEETPYMGAKPFEEKTARKIFEKGGYGFSQMKMDGRYCNAIIRNGEVDLESRQGEPTIVTGAKFLEEISKFNDCVLNGELTMDGVSRYESNGIISSIIDISGKVNERTKSETEKKIRAFELKHGSFNSAIKSIRFTVWDIISVDEYFEQKSSTPYIQRLENLKKVVSSVDNTMVSIVETKEVHSYEEAMNHFQTLLNLGHEGTILKSSNGTWKDGKPAWQCKMKLEMDVDLKIVGFNYGTPGTKNENFISSLNAESSDGLVHTRPQGISEEMMVYITENQEKLLGTIVECKSCGLSQDSKGNYSLLHPVFSKLRDDKNTCDSLESIKSIEAMAKGLEIQQGPK